MAMRTGLKRVLWTAALLFWAGAPATQGASSEPDRTGGPYVPTPQIVVDEMLRMARVNASDFVVDLGSGDGVIVLTAAKQYKARGMGVEIDPELVRQSNDSARRIGVADRAAFQVQDVFKADLSQATVLTLYLLPSMMSDLQAKVFRELKPGARVVSHDYHFGEEWRPDDHFTFDVPEKEKVNGVPRATIYFWVVPAKVAGKWRLRIDGMRGREYEIDLKQRFQKLDGEVLSGGKRLRIEVPELRGEDIRFAVSAGTGRHVFYGRVRGNAMEGEVQLAAGRKGARWTATRLAAD